MRKYTLKELKKPCPLRYGARFDERARCRT